MRTFEEIKAAMLAEKAAYPSLDVLTSESPSAIWLGWVHVTARLLWIQEQIFDAHRAEVETLKQGAVSGTSGYYVQKMLEFQAGDEPYWDPASFQVRYPVLDESKRIIKYAAAVPGPGNTVLKVAADDSGRPVQLTGGHLAQAQAYLRKVQFAGAQIELVSMPPDELVLQAAVYYDGTRDLAALRSAVESSVTSYISSLNFIGYLLRNALLDAMQKVPGVRDVDIVALKAVSAAALISIGRRFDPPSGYFIISPQYPLVQGITYIPE